MCWIWNWKKKNRQIDDGTRENQYFNKFQSIFFSKKKTTKILFKNKSFWNVVLVCHFKGGKIPFDTFIATHDTMNYFNCFFFGASVWMQVVIGNKLAINLINSKSYWFDGCLIRTVKIYGFYPSWKARKRQKITHRFDTDWDWTTKLELKDYHIRFTGLKLYRNQFELCECGCVRVYRCRCNIWSKHHSHLKSQRYVKHDTVTWVQIHGSWISKWKTAQS